MFARRRLLRLAARRPCYAVIETDIHIDPQDDHALPWSLASIAIMASAVYLLGSTAKHSRDFSRDLDEKDHPWL